MSWREACLVRFGPGLFAGITLGRWLGVLRENRFAVGRPYWGRAAAITAGSVPNTVVAAWENFVYGRKIRDTSGAPPLFILGVWRSGTTHLHNLLAQDDRFTFPTTYQASFPHTFLTTERLSTRLFGFSLPAKRPMDNVKFGFAEPQEDEFALCPMTGRAGPMAWAFPQRAGHYGRYLTLRDASADEVAEWKSALLWLVRKLSFKHGRLEAVGVDCDLHEALLMSNLRAGDRLVLYPRWTVDERLSVAERKEFTPTPKQMLYGNRAEMIGLATTKDDSGRDTEGFVEVELQESRGGDFSKPFVFPAINRTLEKGKLYTLDPCPNDWYGYWLGQVVNGLCDGQPSILYDRLVTPPSPGDGAGLPGQKAFLAGLDAFHRAGLIHDFEIGKREFIGGHGRTPVLLVQGPPGTGKSLSSAFAVFGRLQAAMAEKRPYRVFLSCKTHAATDVLLKNVLEVREKLRGLRDGNKKLFAKHFDAQLLDVPLYRVAPNDPPPAGVIHLEKDAEKDKSEDYNADIIQQAQWAEVAITPGGTYGMLKQKWSKSVFGHELCDLLVLDEASQMNLPEAIMAALPI
jgi:hypothetical protein